MTGHGQDHGAGDRQPAQAGVYELLLVECHAANLPRDRGRGQVPGRHQGCPRWAREPGGLARHKGPGLPGEANMAYRTGACTPAWWTGTPRGTYSQDPPLAGAHCREPATLTLPSISPYPVTVIAHLRTRK